MSELIDNAQQKKELLKHMILQLHDGTAPGAVRSQMARLMGEVPYHLVVEVEQELMAEGLPQEEVLKLCDVHTEALKGQISQTGAKEVPPGHPVHTFREENRALGWELEAIRKLLEEVKGLADEADASELMGQIRTRVHTLMDVEKHYQRKENLLFPFLEKHGITGPSTVMWGKHDETRELLAGAIEALAAATESRKAEAASVIDLVLAPALEAVEGMVMKEEEILFPMSMDNLSESEWVSIDQQSLEYGFCLYDPTDKWKPASVAETPTHAVTNGKIQLPSGSFTLSELNTVLNTIPFDLTFVGADDRVRYFTQGRERIFSRSRAILGRKVQLCHPPSSAHIVEKIIEDFRSGKQSRAPFWIQMKGRFIHIEYFALRDEEGRYQGTLEVSQDLTEKRALEGQQRLLEYAGD